MKKSCLVILLALVTVGLMANTVSVQTAQQVATNFYQITYPAAGQVTATLKYTRTEADGIVDFYVFDVTPGRGFVIVSADNNSNPVIGYSNESHFNTTNLAGCPINSWMTRVSAKLHGSILAGVQANTRISNLWSSYQQGVNPGTAKSNVVNPLLTTQWDQEPYYNQLCPFNATDNQRCVTGCVATAMAQIMKYWNFPAQGTGSHSYYDGPPFATNNYGTQSATFDTTTYRWNQMPSYISANNPSVALLMYQCGVSVEMQYGDINQGGSSAVVLSQFAWGGASAQNSYVTYFSYNPNTIQGVVESQYDSADWVNLIEGELNAGRVVQYQGTDPTQGGHTWVCDGYDANNMLHMNWGWGGSLDGYFDISNLNPGSTTFSQDDAALIGIEPLVTIPVTAVANHSTVCLGGNTTLTANGPVTGATYSWTPTTGLSCPTCAVTTAQPTATTTYTVAVDSGGFTGQYTLVIDVAPALVVSSLTTGGVSCYGNTDGSATITVSGGSPSYSFRWNTGQTSANLTNLPEGNYTVTVTDGGGCTATSTGVVAGATEIVPALTPGNSHCGPATAEISADVTGGIPTYFYQWSNGATTANISGLPSGTYTLTVDDNHGCSATASATVTSTGVANPMTITTSVIPASNGGTAVVNVTGGNLPYQSVEWSNGKSTDTVANLAPGTYTVTVTDNNGCQQTATVTIASTTGIGNLTGGISFSVYPNPASTQVAVQLNELNNATSLSVKNLLGQTLQNQAITETQTIIDLSNFADGVYFIEVKQAGQTGVKEVIVRK